MALIFKVNIKQYPKSESNLISDLSLPVPEDLHVAGDKPYLILPSFYPHGPTLYATGES